jgi:uncharacterized membrane protein YeaQ/YmgE (transglycosylase-associated protein family)
MVTLQLDVQSLLVWIVVGLVAGFLAGRVMLGHGLGIAADVVVGILGAVIGGLLAAEFGVQVVVPGHPIISEVIVAFLGALILLFLLRLFFGMGRRRRPVL